MREKTKYFAFYNIIAPKNSFVNYRGKFLAYCTIYLVENGKLIIEKHRAKGTGLYFVYFLRPRRSAEQHLKL